ncbi:MAG TPA: neutral zinc metallopeptidase [Terriglobales bacterium]|nr:neutral zinc metallopeptidase [Terriglobales bacterium]
MRWTPGGRSTDLEDRRGAGPGLRLGGGLGIGGILLLLLLSLIFKRDFLSLVGNGVAPVADSQSQPVSDPSDEPEVQFVSFVLDDAQRTWRDMLAQQGKEYRNAKLVLFRNSVDSACGLASSATGPFYCPREEKVYIDLGFFNELKNRFGAPGDFAQAYVLAHEIGHHVQNLLGIDGQVRQAQNSNPRVRNQMSVRLELQADCLAGVWGHSTAQRNILESGDVDEGLAAAAAVGDNRLQRMTAGQVSPDSFTHGTSEQRSQWFLSGFKSGSIANCNTFSD